MIGDLTGAPEPVVVKLFSPDADLLEHVGAAGGRGAREGQDRRQDADRRRRGRHREHDQRAGRRLHGESPKPRSAPASPPRNSARWASRWWTASRPRAPMHRQRSSISAACPISCVGARSSLEAMSNTMLVNSTGGTATLGSLARSTNCRDRPKSGARTCSGWSK